MMRRTMILFTAWALVLGLYACNSCDTAEGDGPADNRDSIEPEMTWQDYYDLGIRYLSEGNYEEAILAFTAAIEIDPKQAPAYVGRGDAYVLSGETEENLAASKADYVKAIKLDETSAEAYLGLADVYIRQGNYEKALGVLNEGFEKTDSDQSIVDKIAEMEAVVEGSRFFTDTATSPKDFSVGGKPFWELTLEEIQKRYANVNPEGETKSDLYQSNETTRRFDQFMENGRHKTWGHILAQQTIGDAGINSLAFYVYEKRENAGIPLELRNIYMWESCADVLPKLGFEQEWIDEFMLLGPGEDIKFFYNGQSWTADNSQDVEDFVGGSDTARRRIEFYWLDFSCQTVKHANTLYFGLDFNEDDELTEVHFWIHG